MQKADHKKSAPEFDERGEGFADAPQFERSPSQEQVVVGGEDIRKEDTKGDSRRSDLELNKN